MSQIVTVDFSSENQFMNYFMNYINYNPIQMIQTHQILEMCTSIGTLAEITLGEKGGMNQLPLRLAQINRIIEWAKRAKDNSQTENTFHLHGTEQSKANLSPSREQLLTSIDFNIQQQMRSLNVDVALGTQLLPKIMEVIDTHLMILLRQIECLQINSESINNQLKSIRFQNQINQNNRFERFNFKSSDNCESVMTSQTLTSLNQSHHFPNELLISAQKVKQLENKIQVLQGLNTATTKNLQEAIYKNQQLVKQIRLSNSKIQQFQKKIQYAQTQTSRSKITNDLNIKIIEDLRTQKESLNNKITDLLQQLVDQNCKVQQLQNKIRDKSMSTSRILEAASEQKSSLINPKIKDLENQLALNHQQNDSLNTNLKKADVRINQLISSLMVTKGQLQNLKSESQNKTPNKIQTEMLDMYPSGSQQKTVNQQKEVNSKKIQFLPKNQIESFQHVSKEVNSQLLDAQQKIKDLMSQLSISNNHVTDLKLDLQSLKRRSEIQNSSLRSQKRVDEISHELMISQTKNQKMMKMVSNYQNDVIDLQLDKESLIFKLSDATSKLKKYELELETSKRDFNCLTQQIVKLKQLKPSQLSESIKAQLSIMDKYIKNPKIMYQSQSMDETKKQIQNRSLIDRSANVEKKQSNHREFHAHKKIFEGKVRKTYNQSKTKQYL